MERGASFSKYSLCLMILLVGSVITPGAANKSPTKWQVEEWQTLDISCSF